MRHENSGGPGTNRLFFLNTKIAYSKTFIKVLALLFIAKIDMNVLQFVLHMRTCSAPFNNFTINPSWHHYSKKTIPDSSMRHGGIASGNRSVLPAYPLGGAIINGIKESPSQARSRAQAIADGYEAVDKEGTHSVRVKATIKILAGEAVSDVPTIHDFLSNFPDRAKDKVSRSTTNNRKTAVTLFLKYLGSRASLPLTAIHRRDIIGFVEENLREVRAVTVRKYLHSLGPAFRDALDLEYIEVSPHQYDSCRKSEVPSQDQEGNFYPGRSETYTPGSSFRVVQHGYLLRLHGRAAYRRCCVALLGADRYGKAAVVPRYRKDWVKHVYSHPGQVHGAS